MDNRVSKKVLVIWKLFKHLQCSACWKHLPRGLWLSLTKSCSIRLEDCLTFSPSLSQCYHDPLSQWKTHLNLITWARLLLLLLSFTEEPLSFLHPFSILLCFLAALFSLLSRFLSPCAPITGSRQPCTTSQPKHTHTQDIQHSSVIKRPEVQKLLHGALLYHWGQQ